MDDERSGDGLILDCAAFDRHAACRGDDSGLKLGVAVGVGVAFDSGSFLEAALT